MSLHHHHNRHNDPLNPARGLINGLTISAGAMILAGMMWAALSAANSAFEVRATVHQEAFSGFRTASTEQVR